MTALFEAGPDGLARAGAAASTRARRWPVDEVSLLAPVPRPPKVLAIGMNYRAHVAELGREPPEHQYWFNKQRTCVVGPGHPIEIPTVSDQVDYEGELGLVIGRRAKSVPATRWLDVVAGFTVVNDVSVRDWQARTPTFTMGKSFDTHGPMGPWLVTPDDVGDPGDLALATWVNDELRQSSSTSDLIFGCGAMIEYLTTVFPLEVGDVVSTGTPAGVGMGFDPPRWLLPGDTVRIEIEGIGTLANPVVAAGATRP
jgi:2-keto-4-pentenoate hydratase/2-oxohepta-3-ene-1,7-dioic acid hydratase in catechol pathway